MAETQANILKAIRLLNRKGIKANSRTIYTWYGDEINYTEPSIRRFIRMLEVDGKVKRPENTIKMGYLVA